MYIPKQMNPTTSLRIYEYWAGREWKQKLQQLWISNDNEEVEWKDVPVVRDDLKKSKPWQE